MTKRLAIFAGYDGKGQIHDYVVYYLKELKKVADIVFVSDNHFTAESLAPIQDLIIHSICLPHGEYDFGSYKRGYCWAKETGLLDEYDSLIFCNDSVFGPF
ncbi:MAG: rhamnan synthesis F family protein, partial [Planctomycetota bacterium]